MKSKVIITVLVLTCLLSLNVFALNGSIEGEKVSDAKYMADTLWVLVAAFLVFFMQAGFAMVESGFTRAKNAVNILMKNLLDFSMGSIAYWAIGFAIMFGTGSAFMGLSGWFVPADSTAFASLEWSSVPTHAAWLFQLVFAATAATIVSGAMAERTQFKSYLIYSVFITGIIYPVVGHWVWGGGWLSDFGMSDFAGSTVVHSTGGWLALTGAVVLGPRAGKYDSDGNPRPIAGHNLPLAALGVFILWLGWFGFNPGSQMGADAAEISGIAVTTNLAAAAGAITAMITAWIFLGKPDAGMSLNGALAGLVAITAGCASVSPVSAAIIGALGGIVVVLSVLMFEKLRIDDPVGAISVHGTCGALGTILLGFFDSSNGVFFGGGFGLLWAQIVGVVSVLVWCLVTGFILFYGIKAVTGLRVSEEEEQTGLDYEEHGASAYPDFNVSSMR
ncbi:ammonium transporter [Candidatus Poribacteria bacterium]|nr:ammonium transporter [Candidatus Poribacteria bacterium]MYA57442.1 ammonium transporter [Candidatus Poribacteria bacterium]